MKKIKNKIVKFLPDYLWPIKVFILKKFFANCKENVIIGKNSDFIHPENISIGTDVFMAQNFYISTVKAIKIGNRVMFGPKCSIIGGDHKYDNPLDNMRFTKELGDNREIIIENDVWIGYGTLILKKSMIGEGAIIGAMSVVNSKVEPYCVYVGNPIKKIKPRFDTYEELQTYLKMMQNTFSFKSKYTEEELKRIYE